MAQRFSKAFYNSKQWAEVRVYILKRDKYTCQLCGAPAEEVHHKIKLTPQNINDPMIAVNENNLISLCYPCHKAQHAGDTYKKIETGKYNFDANGNIIPPVSSKI